MADSKEVSSCRKACIISAIASAVVLTCLMVWLGGMGFAFAVAVSVLVALVPGAILTMYFCKGGAEEKPAAAVVKAPQAKVEPKAEPAPEPEKATEPGAKPTSAPAEPAPLIKATTPLPGEAALAGQKGAWRYEGGDTAAKHGAAAGSSTNKAAGTQPASLEVARGGKGDDLKKIKGVGPKLEKQLNALGIHHFDQISVWGAAEIAWMDDNLEGFKGRVSRDAWVAQAKKLAGGV